MVTSFRISLGFFLALFLAGNLANPLSDGKVQETIQQEQKELNPKIVRSLFNNDFENGAMDPWLDESPNNVHWVVEDFSSPLDPSSPAPRPSSGSKYLRANRTPTTSSGLAILRSRPFTVLPNDKISLNFWLRSRHPQGNTLKVYWLNNTNEQLLLDLTEISSPSNFEWRQVSTKIPVTTETTTRLVIYGYCGANSEDAIGMDDIVIDSTTSTVSPSTTTTYTYPPWTTTSVPEDCNEFFTSLTGSFSSPNYPNNYPNNAQCQWLILLPQDYIVHLDFNSFRTEAGADFVRVYDGSTTSSVLLGSFSGSSLPSTLHSSSNAMLVEFRSGSSITYQGFQISYTYHDFSQTTSAPTTEDLTASAPTTEDLTSATPSPNCGGTFYSSGYIRSPNYPNNYANYLDCYYYLESYSSQINLHFNSFNTEYNYDFVTVYQGWSTLGTILLDRRSGVYNRFSVYNPYSSRMLVHFFTDGSGTATGFEAYFDYVMKQNSSLPVDVVQQKEEQLQKLH